MGDGPGNKDGNVPKEAATSNFIRRIVDDDLGQVGDVVEEIVA